MFLFPRDQDLDLEFDATLRRYVISVNDFINNHGQMGRANGGGGERPGQGGTAGPGGASNGHGSAQVRYR